MIRDVLPSPEQKTKSDENTKNELKMSTTKEPPRQLRSMAASPRQQQQRTSRSRTSSATSSLETPKTRSTRGLKDEIEYKIGDLVWIKWTDARPYGAIVLGYNQEMKQ